MSVEKVEIMNPKPKIAIPVARKPVPSPMSFKIGCFARIRVILSFGSMKTPHQRTAIITKGGIINRKDLISNMSIPPSFTRNIESLNCKYESLKDLLIGSGIR
jgi:hypothetical protein